jgi:hypothetical protein
MSDENILRAIQKAQKVMDNANVPQEGRRIWFAYEDKEYQLLLGGDLFIKTKIDSWRKCGKHRTVDVLKGFGLL